MTDYLFQNDSYKIYNQEKTRLGTFLVGLWLLVSYIVQLVAAGIVSWCKSKPQDSIIEDEWQMCLSVPPSPPPHSPL